MKKNLRNIEVKSEQADHNNLAHSIVCLVALQRQLPIYPSNSQVKSRLSQNYPFKSNIRSSFRSFVVSSSKFPLNFTLKAHHPNHT